MFFGRKITLKEFFDEIEELSQAKDFLAVNAKRRELVAKWLYVFGYSDRKTLLKLTKTDKGKKSTGYNFIANLVDKGYIQLFRNKYHNTDLFMLGHKGLGILIECGFITPEQAQLPNKRKFIESSKVLHEIGVQESVLLTIHTTYKTANVIEIAKEQRFGSLMVDAKLVIENKDTGKQYTRVVEYERTEKSRQRVEFFLVEHMKNISEYKYHQVFVFFSTETMYQYYQKVMVDKPKEWFKRKDGSFFGGETYEPQGNTHENRLRFYYFQESKNKLTSSSLKDIIQDDKNPMHSYFNEIERKKEKRREIELEREEELIEQIEEQLRPKIEQEIAYIIKKQAKEELLEQLLYQFDELGAFSKGQFRKYLTGEEPI